jgi:hypothetical protein
MHSLYRYDIKAQAASDTTCRPNASAARHWLEVFESLAYGDHRRLLLCQKGFGIEAATPDQAVLLFKPEQGQS